jgi:hypothetical protein
MWLLLLLLVLLLQTASRLPRPELQMTHPINTLASGASTSTVSTAYRQTVSTACRQSVEGSHMVPLRWFRTLLRRSHVCFVIVVYLSLSPRFALIEDMWTFRTTTVTHSSSSLS